jgi:hypothetical protein
MTSIRNMSVVRKAAKEPIPRVMKEGNLEVPFDPRWTIKSDINRVRKVRPAASGWSTRAAVVVWEIESSNSSAFRASATVLSTV